MADGRRTPQRRAAAARPADTDAGTVIISVQRLRPDGVPRRPDLRARRRASGSRCGCSRISRMRATALPRPLAAGRSPRVRAAGPTVDLKNAPAGPGRLDRLVRPGIVNGQNKLVPSITFTFKNVVRPDAHDAAGATSIFRRVGEDEEWGSGFLSVTGSEGLAPGATSQPLTRQIAARLHRHRDRAQQMLAQHAVRRRQAPRSSRSTARPSGRSSASSRSSAG